MYRATTSIKSEESTIRTRLSPLTAWLVASLLAAAAQPGCDDTTDTTDETQDEQLPPQNDGSQGSSRDETMAPPKQLASVVLAGRVVAADRGQPLAGATVRLPAGDEQVESGPDGTYQLRLPGEGEHTVQVKLAQYTTSRVDVVALAPEAGVSAESLHISRDLYLFEKSADLALLVLTTDGAPASAGVQIELSDWRFPDEARAHRMDDEGVPKRVVTDDEGKVLVEDLPATQVVLSVLPCDLNNDGNADTQTTTTTVMLARGQTATTTLVQRAAIQTTQIVAANFSSMYDYEPSAAVEHEPLFAVFSTPMQAEPVTAKLIPLDPYSGNSDALPFLLQAEWQSPVRLEMTPNFNEVQALVSYNVAIDVVSSSGTPFTVFGYAEWTPAPSREIPQTCTEEVTGLALAPDQPPLDFDTSAVTIGWESTGCRGGYVIFARNDVNAEWQKIAFEPSDFDQGRITRTLTIPSQFDRFAGDGRHTPLAGGGLSIAVLPVANAALLPGETNATLVLADVAQPRIADVTASFADFDPSGPQSVVINVIFTEYTGDETAVPELQITDAGGAVDFTLDADTAVWQWSDGLLGGRFTIAIPEGANPAGDLVRVIASDVVDLAGNSAAVDESRETTIAETRFDFESSSQGWTTVGPAWEYGTPSSNTSPRGCSGGTGCWGTILAGYAAAGMWGELISPVLSVPTGAPWLHFWVYADLSYNQTAAVVVRRAGFEDELLAEIGRDYSWVLKAASLEDYAGENVQLIFNYVVHSSFNDERGVYVDDVVVRVDTSEDGTATPLGPCTEPVTNLALDPVQDPLDFNTALFTLAWDAINCHGGYNVFARDDRYNTEWQQVATEPTDFDSGRIVSRIGLPDEFDRYVSDPIQTPLAGMTVTFSVLPETSARPVPGSEDELLVLTDAVSPQMAVELATFGGFDENGPHQFVVDVAFSEYLSGESTVPQLNFEEAGGDPDFVLDPTTATWTWEPGSIGGRFIIPIPEGANPRGDRLWVSAARIVDLSGNESTDLTTPPMEVDGVHFDFDRSTQGWTAEGDVFEYGTMTGSYAGPCTGDSYCWRTVLGDNVPESYSGTLVSPPFPVPANEPILSMSYHLQYDRWDQTFRFYVWHGDNEVSELSLPETSWSSWSNPTLALTEYAGQWIQFAFVFDSMGSGDHMRFYVDNMLITSAGL